LSVQLKGLHTFVGSSVVNSDTNGAGELGGNTSFLWRPHQRRRVQIMKKKYLELL
jgi:hypothetical protein